MKFLPVLFLGVLLGATTLPAADDVRNSLTEGQRALIRGDTATAKADFELVLSNDPNNAIAKNYLRLIATQEAQAGPGAPLTTQLKALVLPRVELKDATFDSALEYLKQQAAKASGGKMKVNFAVQVPESMTSQKVTLALDAVPFTEALRYVCDAAGATYVVEKYAVVIRPKSSTNLASEPAPAPPAPAQ